MKSYETTSPKIYYIDDFIIVTHVINLECLICQLYPLLCSLSTTTTTTNTITKTTTTFFQREVKYYLYYLFNKDNISIKLTTTFDMLLNQETKPNRATTFSCYIFSITIGYALYSLLYMIN